MKKSLIIAVDFDGTIVEHKYPQIGKELPFAFDTLKALQRKGHKLILWTYRTGQELDDAVELCRDKGLEFYAINRNYPEEKLTENIGRKILADLYIDDRNFGGMPQWTDIFQALHPEESRITDKKSEKKWWKIK
ncbi:BT0820 family HAD-type phosphatase [Maribellus sp. CM-23]|uniref:BT0820 family HAD-type phosphatase n=1 Tax=Maribellus sp. CM-23 TaxID=2781026 RepID=UPI001F15B475|nr:hydrolase [Maribellus sp. CM-23]